MQWVSWIPAFAGMTRRSWPPSPKLRHDVHEPFHPLGFDRIPRLAVDLEMGADHDAVLDGEDIADIVDGDAGVGQDRDTPNGLANAREIGSIDRLSRQR